MAALTRRDYRDPFAEVFDWLDSPWPLLHPVTGHPMRMEDYVRDGHYVVRAKLPGIDPEKDLKVTVSSGVLTIKARRQEEAEGKRGSEFRYGELTRTVTLPEGTDEDHIQASYDKGILEVVVSQKNKAAENGQRRIPVRVSRHIKPT